MFVLILCKSKNNIQINNVLDILIVIFLEIFNLPYVLAKSGKLNSSRIYEGPEVTFSGHECLTKRITDFGEMKIHSQLYQ